MKLIFPFLVLMTLSVACTGGLAVGGGPSSLVVWNQSDFDLFDLRVHTARDNFALATNILTSPLQGRDGETGPLSTQGAVVSIQDFYAGTYITVFRRKIETQTDGPKLTLTTAQGLPVRSAGYTLVVFDQSFRLMHPDNADNPFGVLYQ